MSQMSAEDLKPTPDLEIDVDARLLLESELEANQSVRSDKAIVDRLVEDLSRKLFKNKFTTSFVVAVMIVCCVLIAWSVFFRISDKSELLVLETELSEKNEHRRVLMSELSAIDQIDLEEKLEVEHTRVFSGYPAIAVWVNRLVKRADTLSMDIRYSIADANPAPIENVLEVPVVLEFSSKDDSSGSVFVNSMNLISMMLSDQWHQDIVSTSALGGSDGLSRMEVTMKVWVVDTEGFVPVRIASENSDVSEVEFYEEIIQ